MVCLSQRATAALRAISRRCSGLSFAARANPPFLAPRRPSATACGFFLAMTGIMLARPRNASPKKCRRVLALPNPRDAGGCLPRGRPRAGSRRPQPSGLDRLRDPEDLADPHLRPTFGGRAGGQRPEPSAELARPESAAGTRVARYSSRRPPGMNCLGLPRRLGAQRTLAGPAPLDHAAEPIHVKRDHGAAPRASAVTRRPCPSSRCRRSRAGCACWSGRDSRRVNRGGQAVSTSDTAQSATCWEC